MRFPTWPGIPLIELVSNFNAVFIINSLLPCNLIYSLVPGLEHCIIETNYPAYHANWQASFLVCYLISTLLDFSRMNMLNILTETISRLSVNLSKQFLSVTDSSDAASDEVGIRQNWAWVYHAVLWWSHIAIISNLIWILYVLWCEYE